MLSTASNSVVSALAMRSACSNSSARHVAPVNWAHVLQAPPDAILGVAAAYRADPRKDKVNLSVGAYRDEKGRPYVLQCVRKAEAALVKSQPGHEYLPVCFFFPFFKTCSLQHTQHTPLNGVLWDGDGGKRDIFSVSFAHDLVCFDDGQQQRHLFGVCLLGMKNRLADWSRSMWVRV